MIIRCMEKGYINGSLERSIKGFLIKGYKAEDRFLWIRRPLLEVVSLETIRRLFLG